MARHIPKYGVFIIESMDSDNERHCNLNGAAIKSILDLCGIANEYIYIRTIRELEHAAELFSESDFGFLHISCHGSDDILQLTLEDISFEEIESIFGPVLKYRRLFLSACEAACFKLAEYFIPHHHCYSVMGPTGAIDYDKAAIFWSSYYYLMYQGDQQRMWQRNIVPTLVNITRTFSETINYFSIIKESNSKSRTYLREMRFQNGNIIVDCSKKTKFENLYWEEAIANLDTRGDAMESSPESS